MLKLTRKGYQTVRKLVATAEAGASMAEYAVLLGLVSIACLAGAKALGASFNTFFNNAATFMSNLKTGPGP